MSQVAARQAAISGAPGADDGEGGRAAFGMRARC
jgi:hypothetical protein